MRRSTLFFLAAAAFLAVVSFGAFADNNIATTQSPGWMKAQMVGSYASDVTNDAQKLVGLSADQLVTDMGPTALTASDGKGGTEYFYSIDTDRTMSGVSVSDLWVDVDSSGKVTSASLQ